MSAKNASELRTDRSHVAPSRELSNGLHPIRWPEFWVREHQREWVLEPVIPAGAVVALFAKGKVGKSLLALEWAAGLASGRPVLWREAGNPVQVVYVDAEMTVVDLHERLAALGYSKDDDLSRLHYYQLQHFPPLDTEAGGDVLLSIASKHNAAVVIVDTVSRVISGRENDSDTFLALYRHSGMRLKERGIAFLRLDHSGKNLSKGQRGSSAKDQDADVVWKLQENGTESNGDQRLALTAQTSRLQLPSKTIPLVRRSEPLRHELVGPSELSDEAHALVSTLARLGVPLDAGRPAARKCLEAAGETARDQHLADAVRWRKAHGNTHREQVSGTPTGNMPEHPIQELSETVAAKGIQAGNTMAEHVDTDLFPVGAPPPGAHTGRVCATCNEGETQGKRTTDYGGTHYCEDHAPF